MPTFLPRILRVIFLTVLSLTSYSCATAIGNLPWEKASSEALGARLDDPRPVVRDRAIDTLSRRGDDAVAALQSALTAGSPQARRNAIWSLSRIETSSAGAALRSGLTDQDESVRRAAVRSVGVRRDRRAVERLQEILASDVVPLRRAAATAFGQISDASAVARLLSASESGGDDFLMHSLVYALSRAE